MRESLGTVRIHRWTCDVCTRQVENKSKASGSIPLPEGWMHVSLYVDRDGKSRRRDADVCSGECASQYTQDSLKPDEPVEVAAE